jgi:hypothetical protein
MERKQLALLLSQSALASTRKVLAHCPQLPASFSKQQAYRLYGRSDVDRWMAEGLIPTNERIDRLALERIASQSNRITYLTANERKNR